MTSRFIRDIKAHEMRVKQQREDGTLAFSMMRNSGLLRTITVRLPIPTLAMMDFLKRYGPWESRQEIVYRMVLTAFDEFLAQATPETRKEFEAVADAALEEWNKKKSSDSSKGAALRRRAKRVPRKKG